MSYQSAQGSAILSSSGSGLLGAVGSQIFPSISTATFASGATANYFPTVTLPKGIWLLFALITPDNTVNTDWIQGDVNVLVNGNIASKQSINTSIDTILNNWTFQFTQVIISDGTTTSQMNGVITTQGGNTWQWLGGSRAEVQYVCIGAGV